ncbi:hypothetical protein BLNAU_5286 [Blattamonas nauphoetae]|uniref:Uncharacterized protein n=1 Tax=Blattamonas nauphoetae TaxID=2049346 RepID=A0ABQ9Y7U3_9EUKA|nr:hypothetical protein BLNAU_5286 [Blattamonas nauphoetae]
MHSPTSPLHLSHHKQSSHLYFSLLFCVIVNEKTFDCLVIEAKESGHLAELTGCGLPSSLLIYVLDSSSESLSHLSKVAHWKRKKMGEDDTPTKAAVWDDAVQSQTFLDLNAAVSYDGQHTKIFRTCYSFFEQNRHSAVADRRDKTDEPQVKGREELGAVQILDQRVKETLHMEIVKRGCKLEKVRKQNEEKD